MTDAELVKRAVILSGLSQATFAEEICWRSNVVISRWKAGQAMPETVRRRLRWFVEHLTDAQRARFIDAINQHKDWSI